MNKWSVGQILSQISVLCSLVHGQASKFSSFCPTLQAYCLDIVEVEFEFLQAFLELCILPWLHCKQEGLQVKSM